MKFRGKVLFCGTFFNVDRIPYNACDSRELFKKIRATFDDKTVVAVNLNFKCLYMVIRIVNLTLYTLLIELEE